MFLTVKQVPLPMRKPILSVATDNKSSPSPSATTGGNSASTVKTEPKKENQAKPDGKI